MRLGREQASGYVADTATDSLAQEITIDAEERTAPSVVPEPSIPVG
jgi:hypothetical protein